MKNTAKRIVVILIFASIIAAVLLYRTGAYDISFIKRPLPPKQEETDTSAPPDTTPPAVTTDTGEPPVTSDTDETTEPPAPPVTDPLSNIEAEEYLNGLKNVSFDSINVSTAFFDKNSSVVRLTWYGLPTAFSKRNVKVTKNEIYTMKNQRLGIRAVTNTEKQPAITLYFGYIFADQGKNFTVYAPDGSQIATKFTGSLPFLTTLDGQPLVQIGDEYFVLSSGGISSEPVGEEMINRMALAFDFPEYYPGAADSLIPYSDWLLIFNETDVPDTTSDDGTSDVPTDSETNEPDLTSDGNSGSDPADTETEPPATDPGTTNPAVTEVTETEPPASDETGLQTGVATAVEGTFNAEPEDTDTDSSDSSDTPDDTSETEPFPTDVSDGDVIVVNGKTYIVEKKLAWGFKDSNGNIVIPAKYKTVYSFTADGVASVISFEDEVIVVSKTGKIIFNRVEEPVKYSSLMSNVVKTHRRHLGAVNSDLSSIGMYYYDRGYCIVRYAETHQKDINLVNISEYRLANKSGGYYTVPGNYNIVNYSDGVIVVEKEGLYGYFSIEGRWVSPASYIEARPFLQGLAVVRNKDGKYGMINTYGEFVLPTCFDYISDVSRGHVVTWSETRGWEHYCTITNNE
ncbi:MAG: WG repeat-containing protein [Clostridia bacterium]|nr:WG repeat-containing protein [Clostridia bacterium]